MQGIDVFLAVAAYYGISDACDYPIHLGITEAGGMIPGTIKSSIGMGSLLWAGIGDTIRVSLSADPVEEIKVGFNILKSLNLRHRGVNIISCPSCARQNFNVISTVGELEKRLEHITTPMTLSVIGCVVNGPGEAKETDIGLTGGKSHQIYIDGEKHHILREGNMIDHLVELCENKQKELLSKKLKLQKLNSVKGTKDIFGKTVLEHDHVVKTFRDICVFNNFKKISTPILEHENVFVKTLGVSSDIISKEMYNFKDQGGDDLVLRPEGTAAIVRALITNSLQEDTNKNFYYHVTNVQKRETSIWKA